MGEVARPSEGRTSAGNTLDTSEKQSEINQTQFDPGACRVLGLGYHMDERQARLPPCRKGAWVIADRKLNRSE